MPSGGRSPTWSGCSASTGRAPTAPRASSPATPPPPRTSPRRRSSPPSAISTASTGGGRSPRGCTASSSTARSTGRARASCGPRSSSATRLRPAAPELDGSVLAGIGELAPEHRAVVVLRYVLEYTPGRDRRAARPAARNGQLPPAPRPGPDEGAGRMNQVEERAWEIVRRAFEERSPPGAPTAASVGSCSLVVIALRWSSRRRAFAARPGGVRPRPRGGRSRARGARPLLAPRNRTPARRLGRARRRLARATTTGSSGDSAPTGRRVVAARPLSRRHGAERAGRARLPNTACGGRSRAAASRPGLGRNADVDTRIAYIAASGLRVVAGDGTGDRLLDRRAARCPGLGSRAPPHPRLLRGPRDRAARATGAGSSGAHRWAASPRASRGHPTAAGSPSSPARRVIVLDATGRVPADRVDARGRAPAGRIQARLRTGSRSTVRLGGTAR